MTQTPNSPVVADFTATEPVTTRIVLMTVLTFATGVVDAVGYLDLDRVFAGNMTGNVVILGMGLAGADALPVLGPGVALAAFVLGASTAGAGTGGETGTGWTSRITVCLLAVATLLAATAVALLLFPRPTRAVGLTVTGALGLAMGAQAAVARRLAVTDVPTVVVTSTLTALATDIWSRRHPRWVRRLAAVVALTGGAGAGALLLRWHAGAGIALSAALTLGVAVVGGGAQRVRGVPA